MVGPVVAQSGNKPTQYGNKDKPTQIRNSNIVAAKAVCDAIRTSLGPRGMDKMIVGEKGKVSISNDGATILKEMRVLHPAARMLVDLSRSQDIEAGDGTTSVVVLAGTLLQACRRLLEVGVSPWAICEGLRVFSLECCRVLTGMALPVDLNDHGMLEDIASTALHSKVVSQYSSVLSPLCVDAVLRVRRADNTVDLQDIKIVTRQSGTVDDSQLFHGLIFTKISTSDVPKKMAKVALIQFCLSPPKSDMEFTVSVADYTQIDRAFRQEQAYIVERVKAIKNAGVDLLLIQKSILRDATNSMALHFLKKFNIRVVRDIERSDVEIICKAFGCRPIASPDHLIPQNLGMSPLVQETLVGDSKVLKVEAQPDANVCSILLRGSNAMVLEEADRSVHDALCVIRCLVKQSFIVPGGGSTEIELSMALSRYAMQLGGTSQMCVSAFAESLELIPYTLAENAGLQSISTVTQLRNVHRTEGGSRMGIDVSKGRVGCMLEANVIQPLTVNTSAITFACETVSNIMKIDDVIITQGRLY